jgi:type I restriction-modification system DNA methylase subunit
MTIRKKINQKNEVIWILAGFTALILSISFLSLSSLVVNSYAQQNEKIQNLTETNIPKILPLIRGFADGNEVFYITTEVSDENLANYLSNLTNSRVVYTPALKYAPAQSLANIYEFTNGIKGSGPEGFQPNITDSQPGDNNYSPLWKVNLVTWNNCITPRELTSEVDILNALKNRVNN